MKKILFATVAVIAFSTSVAMAITAADLSNQIKGPVEAFYANFNKLTELKTNFNTIAPKLQQLQQLQADLAAINAAIPATTAATHTSKAAALAVLRQAAAEAKNNVDTTLRKCQSQGPWIPPSCMQEYTGFQKALADFNAKIVAIENTAIPQ